jgi:hypothetical protein
MLQVGLEPERPRDLKKEPVFVWTKNLWLRLMDFILAWKAGVVEITAVWGCWKVCTTAVGRTAVH